jgi:hypothetical protein
MSKRDENFVLNEYDIDKWPSVIKLAEDEISNGEKNITRLLNKINIKNRNKNSEKIIDIILNNQNIKIPVEFAINGNQSYICQKILQSCDEKTTAIVELGSGYGRNLFWTWLYGGPQNIKYFGLEYTKSGRKASEIIASLEKDINFISKRFNYYDPNFDFLKKFDGHIVFFTVHSIEQIPTLDKKFFIQLLKLNRNFTCIHFEPVGWQIADVNIHKGSTKEYATFHDYNTNLYMEIMKLNEEKLIKIKEVLPNFLCINPKNGTSVISWTPK